METKKHAEKTNPIDQFGTAPQFAPPLTATSYTGTLLKERYLIEGELGRGGIGVVYLARDTKLHQRRVVIKVLLDTDESSLHTPWLKKKFEQEVEALVRIDHPGVVGVLDVGEMPDGKPFFVMQFVEGVTLRAVMERDLPSGKLDFARLAHIVRQIGLALTAAHEKGIIHRDLKPENVMVQITTEGEETIKLIDFGIASVRNSSTPTGDLGKTKVAGALPYMAPEQLRGEPEPASDTWALAVMVYEMLSGGRLPFDGETMVKLHEQQRTGPAMTLTNLRPDLPADAAQLIARTLSFAPADRPVRARDFGEALAESLLAAVPRAIPTANPGTLSAVPSAPTLLDHTDKIQFAPETTISPETISTATGAPHAASSVNATTTLPAVPRRSPWPLIALAALVIASLIAAVIWMTRPDPAVTTNQPVVNETPSRTLSYSLSVRLKKNAGGAPVEMPGEVIFSPGDELRFKLISPQDGFLYVIGEGPQPDAETGLPLYNLLFPKAQTVTAEIKANQMFYLPNETGAGLFVDKEQGAEKIWLVWSSNSVAELDSLKRWYNDKDKGAINDKADTEKVRDYLRGNLAAKPVAEKDAKQMTLKGGLSDVLIYPIELAHY